MKAENKKKELSVQDEKQEKNGRTGKKKRLIIILSGVCVLLLAGGISVFFLVKDRNGAGQRDMPFAMENMDENIISASGLTSVGMLEEMWELDFLDTSIYVEESYLSIGDEVEAGTAVFKVSEDTLEEARKELENAVVEAELAYRQGVIDYETGVIDARTEYETAAVNKKYSQAEYDNAAAEAAKQVEMLEEQVEAARELAEEYTKSVNEDYYRTYYKVDELYQTYYEHFLLLMEFYEKWDIEEKESNYGSSSSSLGGSSSSNTGTGTGSGTSQSAGVNKLSSSTQKNSASAGNTVNNANLTTTSDVQFLSISLDTLSWENLTSGLKSVQNDGTGNDGNTNGDSTGGSGGDGGDGGDGNGDGGDGGDGNGDGENDGDEDGGSSDDNKNEGNSGQSSAGMPQGKQGESGQEKDMDGMSEMQGTGVTGSYSEEESQLSVYNMLDEMVQEESKNYKTALENYETASRKAAAGLEQALSNLEALEAELVQAQTRYEKQLISCKADYEITIAESDNAEAVYETTLESLEETLAVLADDKEEAEENLALFEEVIGDGYFYTQNAGIIVLNGVRAKSYLSGKSLVAAYSNPETVSVTASVDQSNIADISIGDSAYVTVSEYGSYHGTVTFINPVTQAQSRSSVTYQVTITLDGDVSSLDSNLTAYVYFGMSDEVMQRLEKTAGAGEDGGEMPGEGMDEDDGGMPDGDFGDRGGDMPNGGSGDRDGEMPDGGSGDRGGRMSNEESGDRGGEMPDREASGQGRQRGSEGDGQ